MQENAQAVNSQVATNGLFISRTLKEAWKIFKEEWITIYAINAISFAIAIVYSVLASSLEKNSISWLFDVFYVLVQVVVGMGMINAYLSIVRGKKVNLETFTSTIPNSLKYIGAQFLMGVIVLIGLVLFIIPGLIFGIKFMFAPYLVVDKGLGPIEALKESDKLTSGKKWDIAGFMAATAILAYSGILALFVGLVVTIPVATVAYVVFYNSVVKKKI